MKKKKMTKKEIEMYEKGAKLLVLFLKVGKPKLTDREAEQIIINVGNYLQLKKLKAL